MSFKPHFSQFLAARPERLHFAAHSHHPWPDVSLDAHQQAWLDAARWADDKWDYVFGKLVPEVRALVAGVLGLSDPSTLVFAANTHELVTRVFSALPLPVRVLTTGAEFHSFTRQLRAWEENGMAEAVVVPAEPFESFADRFTDAARSEPFGLVYLSQVFFDSGFLVPRLERVLSALPDNRTLVVIDGYHGFMAVPTDLTPLEDRAFYVGGGYKYAMAGEGAGFMHAPPGYVPRPVDTGWFAGFEDLRAGPGGLAYPAGGDRFWGGTFDPTGLYRLRAVLELLGRLGLTVAALHRHVEALQQNFLLGLEERDIQLGELLPGPGLWPRGNLLTFRSGRAAEIYRRLHEREVVTDYRRDRLRIGFGIYHDPEDVEELLRRLGPATH